MLYAFADSRWWVQPFESAPRTEIADDGSWKARIHLGTEYAAILSKADTQPTPFVDALPKVGNGIEAIATVKGSGNETPAPDDATNQPNLRFSGLEWTVRTIPGDRASKTNEYSADNVFVDDSGALHLRLIRNSHGWVCSEIRSVRSFGYGNYTVDILDAGHFEPAVMFSAYTFFEHPTDGDHRELAIRLTQRGVASNTNAEFSIQPSFVPANFYHFNVPPGALKLAMQWHPDQANFSVSRVQTSFLEPVVSWPFRTGLPISDDTHMYFNLCNYGYAPTPPTHDTEVVVRSFRFYP
ncbi:hypothetical protein [Granulicella sp. L46]|uniref:hypothetical protein n=1 Tax=Granulicella sp. L46 TaxID=1641865 RepID=UPI00131B118F|nr:hypothetical protein [Granulicella sp. L46]